MPLAKISAETRILFAWTLFSIALYLVRVEVHQKWNYLFLNWNLGLAAIPWFLSLMLPKQNERFAFRLLGWMIIPVWLLFFPNAPYIITDLIHIRSGKPSLKWFDIFMISSYAISGLLFGLLSLQRILKWIAPQAGIRATLFFGSLLLILAAYGVYLGRFLRWNSWDLFTRPEDLLSDVYFTLRHPYSNPRAWGVTLVLGLMLNLIFFSFVKISSLRKQERS
ncbi:MAG: DUF1361 domain-containing protein [Bacteroidetes bacterium]|nr:DUF1361 domain-containing protein [Bacteroidota bacterium]